MPYQSATCTSYKGKLLLPTSKLNLEILHLIDLQKCTTGGNSWSSVTFRKSPEIDKCSQYGLQNGILPHNKMISDAQEPPLA